MTPVLFGDVVDADIKELREIARWFDLRGDKNNGDFLRGVASRHEVLAGAYSSALIRERSEIANPQNAT